MNKKKDFAPFISSLVAIVCGLVIGFIILCISNPNEALAGFATILPGPITHGMNGIGQVLYYATPLMRIIPRERNTLILRPELP